MTGATSRASRRRCAPLRILFIGQAVERKGLPVLLRAFEALREQVPATLTLVGASAEEVAHMMLDDRGVHALGKVSEARKLRRARRAPTCCARPRCTARASAWSSPRRSPPRRP